MKKLFLLSLVLVVLVSGCGKKKCASDKSKGKELVENTDIPTMSEENEKFVDNEGLSDFAFVDDEEVSPDSEKGDKLAEAAPVATGQPEFAWVENDGPAEEEEATVPSEETEKAFDFKTVNFTLNKNNIRTDQVKNIEHDCQVAKSAMENGKKVVVQGHCCQLGAYSYNMALSQRRADTIKKELVKRGVKEDVIKTVGYGSELPLVWSDKTDRKSLVEELAVNRRAEIVVN
jgi:outer membrane protein OmpA-like peptidoglycan-associated protein